MRMLIVLCFCGSAVYDITGQDIESMKNMPKYDARYDYLDVDALFNSKRLVRNYVECLINGLRCTPEGKALKRLLPEALRTKCVRCSERQKRTAVKIIKRLKYEYPEEWAQLASKWDPTGDFTRYFEVYLANEQLNTISYNGVDIPPVSPPDAPPTSAPVTIQVPVVNTPVPPRPLLLNRFGNDGELIIGSPSSGVITTQRTTTPRSSIPPTRPINPPRPTPVSWTFAGQDMMTRFPMKTEQPYTTAITLIDQIGIKIIKTTELVTDILKNTVRAVVG